MSSNLSKNLAGGAVGNVLEWYDFAVFAYFAPTIGTHFFPTPASGAPGAHASTPLLYAFAVFAGAYVVRPIGGVLFGYIGDRLGRKPALQLSVVLMAFSTTAMGVLPTYDRIGLAAPLLLIALRVIQGLSVGGELVGSMSFLTEIAPPRKRGLFGSLSMCSATGGVLLGSLVAVVLHGLLAPADLEAWGWRLPFLAGVGVGGFALWMREGIVESEIFTRDSETSEPDRTPLWQVTTQMPGRVIHVAALTALHAGGFYMLFVWWPTYAAELLDPPVQHAFLANSIAMTALMLLTPAAGALSDIMARGRVLALASVLVLVAARPLFGVASAATFSSMLSAQIAFAILMAGVAGPLPAAMAEMFPTHVRYTGIALGYNLCLALFGGTAPLICTWLITSTGNIMAPAYYLMALAAVTLLAGLTWSPLRRFGAQRGPPRRRIIIPLPPRTRDDD